MIINWTEERVAELKRLWTEGYSASQTAVALGSTTRNAVVGKRFRLGLRDKKRSVHPPKSMEGRKVRLLQKSRLTLKPRYGVPLKPAKSTDTFERKKDVRAKFSAKGTSRTSVAY